MKEDTIMDKVEMICKQDVLDLIDEYRSKDSINWWEDEIADPGGLLADIDNLPVVTLYKGDDNK